MSSGFFEVFRINNDEEVDTFRDQLNKVWEKKFRFTGQSDDTD